jgi:hypothetical protein
MEAEVGASGPSGEPVSEPPIPSIPARIADVAVPRDPISVATWAWAQRRLPTYLLTHSVRSYCWGSEIARLKGLEFEPPILWAAALIHDIGLTQVSRNERCFEFQGGAIARRFLASQGMATAAADRVGRAIELHMAPSVTLADGTESVLLDRATGLDVRGAGYDLVGRVRPGVVTAFPRGPFDRHFLAAIAREVEARPGCQSERLLRQGDLATAMARSPWVTRGRPD